MTWPLFRVTSHTLLRAAARFLLLLLFSFSVAAQSDYIKRWPDSVNALVSEVRKTPDSTITELQRAFAAAESDEDKAAVHALISRAYSALMLHKKALEHADNGLELVSPANQPWLYYNLTVAKAEAMDTAGDAQQGLTYTQSAIAWAKSTEHYDLLTYALSIQGYIHLALSTTDDALSYFQEGYRLAKEHSTLLKPEDFASMIALVYEYREEWHQAIPYYQRAEAYYRETNASLELANTLFGLGKAYFNTGETEKAMPYLRDSANLALEIGDLQGAAYSYAIMANHLINQGKYIDAESFLTEALSIFEDAENPYMQIQALISLAKVEEQKNQFESAMRMLDRADDMADGNAFLVQKIQIGMEKSRIYASFGEYEKAYQLMLILRNLQEDLEQEQNSRRLLELRTAFEVEQQEAQNALLKEQNLRQQTQIMNEQSLQKYVIAVAFLLVIICLLLLFLYVNGKRHQRRLELLANEDELTGLLTRRKTLDVVDNQLHLAIRHDDPFAIAILDLDFFKQINDKFGHQTGDDVLRAFGKLAVKTFRSTDILGRIGGEEFMFAFPHTPAVKAESLLKKFAESVRDIPFTIGNNQCRVSVSVGLVDTSAARTTSELTALADEALYDAKKAGRDRIVWHQPPA